MLKKSILFNDLDGKPITEDFYFQLSEAELTEMHLSQDGGLVEYLQRIVEDKNGAAIIGTFKDIISKSVGRRSEDNKRFIKSEDIRNEFMQTDAYSVLFVELVTDAEASAAFINGIVPSSLRNKLPTTTVDVKLPLDLPSNAVKEVKDVASNYTNIELISMPQDQFDALVGTNPQKMDRDHLILAMQRKTKPQQ